ncbi:hypothetical protein GJ654_18795 [Rhodoblastus acidophilus]|uniref:Mu-like prophage tail sheath protein gpL n=1 Tax=Rhodoblastus acidophilus TaxID=1074 RepID=A0A6N8DQY8_RHOAC|nr:phage tail sheath subtilisin-like domain-containing protein [Rhodoblastus acidophilus]MCW2276377.1 phage tail sheath gpL-like [Rhodoblastus acidophilus]MTV33032.1 hypothetical protein [Rhodoblastus acidophilus]
MGNVAFESMPSNIRTSLFFAEFNAGAAPYNSTSRHVLIAHAKAGYPAVGGLNELGGGNPSNLFGLGSMAADMALYAREHDPLGAISVLVVAEPTGDKASATVTFAGPATAGGTFTRYIAGQAVSVAVAVGDTAASVAAAFKAAVDAGYTQFNLRMGYPVTAAVNSAVVTLTAVHNGSYGNDIRIESALQGENDPAGITVTYSGGTAASTVNSAYLLGGGSGEVDMAAALARLGPVNAEWISGPWASTAQLNASQTFLANSGSGRWAPTVQQGGHYITARPGTLSELTAFGAARNDPHATILGIRGMPAAPWVVAAAVGGVVARSKNLGAPLSQATEIARPLQTIALSGILAPYAPSSYWARADRESLYRNGIAAYTVDAAKTVRLERLVTTYQRNPYDTPDTTWLDIETLAISQYVGRYMRHRVESLFPRCVLVDENPNNNQGVVTTDALRAANIHAYTELAGASLVENVALFAKYLIVERDSDPNRVNSFLPTDVANQFRVFAANITIYTQMTDALLNG